MWVVKWFGGWIGSGKIRMEVFLVKVLLLGSYRMVMVIIVCMVVGLGVYNKMLSVYDLSICNMESKMCKESFFSDILFL